MKFGFVALLVFLSRAFAQFGVTNSGSSVVAQSDVGLVATIHLGNGDVTSLVFNGTELQDSSRFTQIGSGIGSATVTYNTTNDITIITISTSIITHYYVLRSGVNSLYMGTFISAEPSIGELRFITRLAKSALPNGNPAAEVHGGSAIEGKDVFLVNGQTRSKFYSSVRFIDDQVHGVTGTGVGVFMIIPDVSYESSSGGPFFRDINNQGSSQQELYWYMNSGHEKAEAYRTGFFGPYALAITNGSTPPASFDTGFMDNLGLQGYVGASGRGTVSGSYSGILPDSTVTIGFQNMAAQYWTTGSNGSFTRDLMKPGTYTATLYQGELEAGTGSVTVSMGQISSLALTSNLTRSYNIWSIGTVDGTPAGFLNADKIETMHPSDSRMSLWGPINFIVGVSSASSFPMAQFQDVNCPTTIEWTAISSQIGARTLRIRTTSAFAAGRPQVTVNYWSSDIPALPPAVHSRGVTRGTWRGVNQVYDFMIPSGILVAGTNTIAISVVSGSPGVRFLSPNFVYDSIELF